MDGIIETGHPSGKKGKKRFSDYIYTPDSQNVPRSVVVIGYILRASIVWLTVSGLTLFFTDAFFPEMIDHTFLILAAAVWTMLFSIMRLSKKCFWIGGGVTCVLYVAALLPMSDSLSYLPDCVFCAWDSVVNRLTEAGFQAPGFLGSGYYGTVFLTSHLLGFTAFMMIPLLTLIFSLSVMKRVRLLPMLAVGTLVCVPVFTYNFCDSNWGFALIIAALCAILVLRHYDICFRSQRITVRTSALGGYSGFTALLLSLLLISVPAANITESWKTIDRIADGMNIARTLVSSIIIGEKPNWSAVSGGGNVDSLGNRTSQASDRNYTGVRIAELQTNFNVPVYLRSWIAQNYSDDIWRIANPTEIDEYVSRFGDDFSPEAITSQFYKDTGLNPERYAGPGSYSNQSKYGFITSQVTINILSSGGNSLPVPSRFASEIGFLAFESENLTTPYKEKVTNYHEGIFTTGWLNLSKQYTTVAYLPLYRDPDFAKTMDLELLKITFSRNLIREYISAVSVISGYSFDQFLSDYFKDSQTLVTSYPTLNAFSQMTKAEQEQYIKNLQLYDQYTEYVQNQYLQAEDSDIIREISNDILEEYLRDTWNDYPTFALPSYHEPDDFSYRHNMVLRVVNYLRDNCTYTLHPKEQRDPDLTAVESFLTETQQGYCVQYATAACMLLRQLGIPARYVEGYLAGDLTFNKKHDTYGKYTQTIRDYDQHAWIEVYYPEIGWMTYEATSVFCDDLYKPYESGSTVPDSSDETTPSVEPETTPPADTSLPETKPSADDTEPVAVVNPGDDNTNGTWLLFGILIIGGGTGFGIFFFLRAFSEKKRKIIYERTSMINAALHENVTAEESRLIARKLNDMIALTAKVGGLEPEKGELPSQYAFRIDAALKETPGAPSLLYPFNKIVPIMERGEFRGKVSREELKALAEFQLDLARESKKRLNPFESLWYEKIRCMI